jgi:ABC-type transporter Mla MlaB component
MISVVVAKNNHFRAELGVDLAEKKISVKLVGEVTEKAELVAIWDYVAKLGPDVKRIEFDLGEVSRINSEGVRRWVELLNRAQSRLSCRFIMLSVPIIQQASVVAGILGKPNTPIHAFHAPFLCVRCGKEVIKPLSAELVRNPDTGACTVPQISCDSCGGGLRFDDIESEYFFFLS